MTLVGGSGDAQHPDMRTAHVVRMKLAGANAEPQVVGLEKLPGIVNYFIGNDPTKWLTEIPTFAKVRYESVYPGIDLVYYGNQGRLEHDFVVAAGADPSVIQVAFEGMDKIETDAKGDLILYTAGDELHFSKPEIYQVVDGVRRPVAGSYTLRGRSSTVVGFELAGYDGTKEIVIDPTLFYSTYVGGGPNNPFTGSDIGNAIAVDTNRNTYIVGATGSPDFPTPAHCNPTRGGEAHKRMSSSPN